MALWISGHTFNFADCEVTPLAPVGGDCCVDVRAHADDLQHRQVLEALAETTSPPRQLIAAAVNPAAGAESDPRDFLVRASQ